MEGRAEVKRCKEVVQGLRSGKRLKVENERWGGEVRSRGDEQFGDEDGDVGSRNEGHGAGQPR